MDVLDPKVQAAVKDVTGKDPVIQAPSLDVNSPQVRAAVLAVAGPAALKKADGTSGINDTALKSMDQISGEGPLGRIQKGMTEGVYEFGLGAKRVLDKVVDLLSGSNLSKSDRDNLKFAKEYFSAQNPGVNDAILREFGKSLPFMVAPEATGFSAYNKFIDGLAESLAGGKDAAPIYKALMKAASIPAKYAPEGAVIGAVGADPDTSLKNAAEYGAILNPIAGTAAAGLSRVPALAVSKLSMINSRRMLKNLKTLKKGGQEPIGGEALGMPWLQQFQSSWLANFLGSGQGGLFKRVWASLIKQAGGIYQKIGLSGKSADDAMTSIFKQVRENDEAIGAQKNKIYGESEEINRNANIPMKKRASKAVAKDALSRYRAYVAQYPHAADPQFESILENIANGQETVTPKQMLDLINSADDQFIDETKNMSPEALAYIQNTTDAAEKNAALEGQMGADHMKFAKFAASDFNELAKKDPSEFKRGVLNSLSAALRKDVRDSVEASGNKDAINALNKADNFYKSAYAQFKHKALSPYLYKNDDPLSLFKKFVGTGRAHNPYMIDRLWRVTGRRGKQSMLDAIFSDVITENKYGKFVNPVKLYTKFKELSKDTRNLLLTPEAQKTLETLGKRLNLAESALKQFIDPATGHNIVKQKGLETYLKMALKVGGAPLAAAGVIHGNKNDNRAEFWIGLAALLGSPIARKYIIDHPDMLKAFARSALKNPNTKENAYARINPLVVNSLEN
jgi:hypothetical protein